MPAVLDAGAEIGDADLGFAEPGSTSGLASSTALNVTVRQVTFEAWSGDADTGTLLSAPLAGRCAFGWDQATSIGEVTFATDPGVANNGLVTIRMGAGLHNVVRFVGYLRERSFSDVPRGVTLHLEGSLYRLEEYENQTETAYADEGRPGLAFDDLVGGSSGATLRTIVTAVLTQAGVSYTLGNLDNPPHVFGLVAPEEMTWGTHEAGMPFLGRFFEATAGERLFNSADGQTYMAPIVGRPRNVNDLGLGTADILVGSRGTRSIKKTRNRVHVEGFDPGDGVYEAVVDAPNALQPTAGTHPHRFASTLIESDAYAAEIAGYWAQELSRELVQVDLSTWRDDVIGPGQTHLVDALDRLGVGEPLCVLHVELEVSADGAFTQHITYVGGGPAADYDPPQV